MPVPSRLGGRAATRGRAARGRGAGGFWVRLPVSQRQVRRPRRPRARAVPGVPGWSYDYPAMENNLAQVLHDITTLRPNLEAADILDFDNQQLFRYPLVFLSEPGYWMPTATEAEGLRTYLRKGGFLIVDDFHFPNEWAVFEAAIRRVLPAGRIYRLDASHSIYNTFFAIKSLEIPYPGTSGPGALMGEFFGIFEDNDPRKDLMVVINYNMDLGDISSGPTIRGTASRWPRPTKRTNS